ncbi:hypothetical protein MTO96_032240 [Rhipicephalus appendiculatus]
MSTDPNGPFIASTCEKPSNCGQHASSTLATPCDNQGDDSGRMCAEPQPSFRAGKKTDFSIDGLLSSGVWPSPNPSSNTGSSHYSATRAPAAVREGLLTRPAASELARTCDQGPDAAFEWLQCSRYKPPKLPTAGRGEFPRRRYVGRNPRIPFTGAQVSALEAQFAASRYLSGAQVNNVAIRLGLTEKRLFPYDSPHHFPQEVDVAREGC